MRIPHLVAATAIGALALAACGSGGSYSSSSPAAAPPPPASVANATHATVSTGQTALGDVLVDANGMTLYGRTSDTQGVPSCDGACATAWPPVTVSTATLPSGLDAKVFSVVTRTDGTHQLRAGKWPLYRYAGDAAPGDTNGQGSGGVWFVVTPSGALHKS
jgi:predicted lipoprotein with Yx(FWY)xxD motif